MRFGLLFALVCLIWACIGDDYDDYNEEENYEVAERKAKWFGVGIVRFENKYCVGLDGLDGTCYTRRQCRDLNGTRSGLCAATIGHCCILQRSCGQASSYNNTYFVNQNFPATVGNGAMCTYVIKKCNPDICQARIDFLTLTLAPPDANGLCIYDSLRITGGSSIVRPICGENSGQHVYVGFFHEDDITITINTSPDYVISRSWHLKVAQIGCDCPTTAPDGCLMFYTGLEGTVKSFNYGRTTTAETYAMQNVDALPGTREMANMNYGVCIKMLPGYCGIEWSKTSNNSFAVSGSTPAGHLQGVQIECDNDFVVIPNPEFDVQPAVMILDRFCGNDFPTLKTYSKPFVLTVVTDAMEKHSDTDINLNEIGNLGFSLKYRQIPCSGLIF